MKPKFIHFIEAESKLKTKTWEVWSGKDEGGAMLGIVKWYAPWRKYSFFPESMTLFEQTCLRDLADFCQTKTTDHWTELKARRISADIDEVMKNAGR